MGYTELIVALLVAWMLYGIRVVGEAHRRPNARAFWTWWVTGCVLVALWFWR